MMYMLFIYFRLFEGSDFVPPLEIGNIFADFSCVGRRPLFILCLVSIVIGLKHWLPS